MSQRRVRLTLGVVAALVAGGLAIGVQGASALAPPAALAPPTALGSSAAHEAAGGDALRVPAPKPSASPGSKDDHGAAATGHGRGWWKHVYSGHGRSKVDAATAQGYLDTVASASAVFPEQTDASTPAAAHAVLSPKGADPRARATAALLVAWLTSASGAIADDDVVTLPAGDATFHELMLRAEEVILDPGASRAELRAVARDLARAAHTRGGP